MPAFIFLLAIFCANFIQIFGVEENSGDDLFDELWQLAKLEKINSEKNHRQKLGENQIKIEQNDDDENVAECSQKCFKKEIKKEKIFDSEKEEKKIKNLQKTTIKKDEPIKMVKKEDEEFEKSEMRRKRMMIISEFDNRRKEQRLKKGHKRENRHKFEKKIAKELGIYRNKIYKWKKEIGNKNKRKMPNQEEKMWMIEQFERMKKESKEKKEYKMEERNKIEVKIANELGTNRHKIFAWKKEINANKKKRIEETEEEKRIKISQFDQMRKEYKKRNVYKRDEKTKIENEIAKALDTNRSRIYKWKKQIGGTKKKRIEEEKEEEEEKVGIICKWKKELAQSKHLSSHEKSEIIEQFEKIKEEIWEKFGVKTNEQIDGKIAKKLGIF